MIWHRMLRPRKRLAYMNMPDAEKPTVDVLIPCYTEPIEVCVFAVIRMES